MKGVRKRALDGENFADLAAEFSDCDDESNLGFIRPGEMVEAFDMVVFSMNSGEVSPVFVTDFGYHVAKVFETKDARQLGLDQVKADIKQQLYAQKEEMAIRTYIDTLAAKANIVDTDNG